MPGMRGLQPNPQVHCDSERMVAVEGSDRIRQGKRREVGSASGLQIRNQVQIPRVSYRVRSDPKGVLRPGSLMKEFILVHRLDSTRKEVPAPDRQHRSEEHTSELQSRVDISY